MLDESASRWWIAADESALPAVATRAAEIGGGTRIWVACEAAAMRRIRRYFTGERALPASSLVTRGYWRTGESNHPDHDYGEDT